MCFIGTRDVMKLHKPGNIKNKPKITNKPSDNN